VLNWMTNHEQVLFPEEMNFPFPAITPDQVRVKPYQPDTPEMRADLAREYNANTLMDRQIGEKLKELERDGLAENTIIFYYGDNGGITARSKRFMQDNGTHVPLIVYFPPKWQHLAPAAPGSRISAPVHFTDIPATILALAGVPRPEYMQGIPFAGDPDAKPRQFVLCTRDRMDDFHDMIRAVTDGRWRYVRNFRPDIPYVQPISYMFMARGYQSWAQLAREGKLTPQTAQFWGRKPPEELYDCETDPHNVVNLAKDPAHAERLQTMRKWMYDQMVANFDNGLLPEHHALEGYDASRRPGAWDVAKTLDAAIMASDSNPKNLDSLMQAAQNESMPVRWWAVAGLGLLKTQAESAQPLLSKLAEADPSFDVRLAAIYALSQTGHTEKALDNIRTMIQKRQSPNSFATVLYWMGEAARPLLPDLNEALSNSGKSPVMNYVLDTLEGRQQPLVYPGY